MPSLRHLVFVTSTFATGEYAAGAVAVALAVGVVAISFVQLLAFMGSGPCCIRVSSSALVPRLKFEKIGVNGDFFLK